MIFSWIDELFAEPMWLLALLLLPLFIALRVWSVLSNRRSLDGLVAPRLFEKLVSRTRQLQQSFSFGFLMVGVAFLIIALARPQWGYEEIEETYSEGRSIMVAIDTSRSMLATDLVPNRLERAKLAARDIVDGMPEDRIGLVAFAGRAFLQAPLTNDHEAIIESIDQVDTELIPRGGTNLTAAASQALSAFKEANSKQNALIIFSDGEALEGQGELEKIKTAAKADNMTIITIGVGTEQGALIPEYGADGRPIEGAFLKDSEGKIVRSRLDPSALRGLASGGGLYIQLGDRGSLTQVVKTITASLETNLTKLEEVEQRRIERFMWPLSIAAVCLLLAHLCSLVFSLGRKHFKGKAASPRKKLAALSALGWLLLAAPTSSSASDGWWYLERENFPSAIESFQTALAEQENAAPEADRRGRRSRGVGQLIGRLLERGQSDRERTDLQLGLGSAAYRTGDYEMAAKAYGEALIRPSRRTREQAHYNLGNTLYRKGQATIGQSDQGAPGDLMEMTVDPKKVEQTLRQWVGALEHYEAALDINKRNADARHNIKVLKEKIAELENKPPPPEEEQQQEQQQEENQDQENQDEQENQDQQDSGEGQENEQDQQENQQGEEGEQNGDQQDQGEDQDSQQGSEGDESDADSQDNQSQNGEGDSQDGQQGQPQEPAERSEQQQQQDQEASEQSDKEGELSAAEPSSEQEQREREAAAARAAAQAMKNPTTGYSPTEARNLIEALADEDGELRPVYPRPYKAERYQDW